MAVSRNPATAAITKPTDKRADSTSVFANAALVVYAPDEGSYRAAKAVEALVEKNHGSVDIRRQDAPRSAKLTSFNLHYDNDAEQRLLQETFNQVGATNVRFMGHHSGPVNFDLETAQQAAQLLETLRDENFQRRDIRLNPGRINLYLSS